MTNEQIHLLKDSPTPREASRRIYDAVIVGAGVSGAILAMELSRAGFSVLVLEAGAGRDYSQEGSQRYRDTFYSAPSKDNNAPFARNPNADMPRGQDNHALRPGQGPNADSYLVQNGPLITDTVYSRVFGGTTVHWEGKTIRMLRDDFHTCKKFGQGLDWPITLDTLLPYYRRAEHELGVAGDADAQHNLGVEFDDHFVKSKNAPYVYPMVELKPSYLDQMVTNGLKGMPEVELAGEKFPLDLSTFPQAKNADPNPDYAKFNVWGGHKPYKPIGAIRFDGTHEGERCQGNSACVPLCPVQARYDSRKTMVKAQFTGRTTLLTQAVASLVEFDRASGEVTGVVAKIYNDPKSPVYENVRFQGRQIFLAANAVENARLMLASSVLNHRPVNPWIGRNLMDHPYLLSWALLPENAGVGRGPTCTSGFCRFRNGKFRSEMAPFAADIHNDGWGWATGSPNYDLNLAVDDGKYGAELRDQLTQQISRQLLLAYMIELPADPSNCVSVSPQYTDALGNMRPIFNFDLPEYSLKTVEFTRNLSRQIFKRLKADDQTHYFASDYGYCVYNNQGYAIRGGNHLAGTHVMGNWDRTSAVDENQRSWEHRNLYLVGPGSLCSIGSSNTTLTTAALAFKTADAAVRELKSAPLAC